MSKDEKVKHTPAICQLKRLSAKKWLDDNPGAYAHLLSIANESERCEIRMLMDEFAEAVLEDAAAPDMLEALKGLLALATEPYDGFGGRVAAAQAAISKATGQAEKVSA